MGLADDVRGPVTAPACPPCDVAGCRAVAVGHVEVALPAAWGTSPWFATLTIHASLCEGHGQRLASGVSALLEAGLAYSDVLQVLAIALAYEHGLHQRSAGAEAEAGAAGEAG